MAETLDDQMMALAKHIAAKASAAETALSDSVDAFKALTAYHALALKHRLSDDDEDDVTMGALVTRIAETSHGGTPIPDRRRSS